MYRWLITSGRDFSLGARVTYRLGGARPQVDTYQESSLTFYESVLSISRKDCRIDRVIDRLSTERLTKYVHRTRGDKVLALTLYVWNHDVGSMLGFLLQQFEVCLRNSVARALCDRWGPDWHDVTAFTHRNREVTDLYRKTRTKAEENRPCQPVRNSDFIAATGLSFWREVCKPHWVGEIWSKRLPIAFPNMNIEKEIRKNLENLHSKINLIVALRNRIAHHEPILGNKYERIGAKLEDRHADIIRIIGWMDEDFLHWTSSHDRFTEILQKCPVKR